MASRIQGITVEIGGNTMKLSKALEDVNKTDNDKIFVFAPLDFTFFLKMRKKVSA